MLPLLTVRVEDGRSLPVLVWRLDPPRLAISSAPLGGGIGVRHWVVNATVHMSYSRNDPDAHLAEIADRLDLVGAGVGLMTGVDVADRVAGDDGGVAVTATVGLGSPAWAAAPDGHLRRLRPGTITPGPITPGPITPGTVNVVAFVPRRLGHAALVNAVATVAEAKAQALWDLGLPATGTASDATCVLCPVDGPEQPYGGPRSQWGARLARAVHDAVRLGSAGWLAGGRAWSERRSERPPERLSDNSGGDGAVTSAVSSPGAAGPGPS